MTKSITDLAEEAGLLGPTSRVGDSHAATERFAALHRASIIESLTGEMPEPITLIELSSGGSVAVSPRVTIDQMREYAAGLVAKAVAAERKECAELCEHLSARACDAGDCADSIMERGNK